MAGNKCADKEFCKNQCPEGQYGECPVITREKQEKFDLVDLYVD